MDMPTTLIEAVRYFADLDRCEELMRKMRWPTGTIRCPECDSTQAASVGLILSAPSLRPSAAGLFFSP